MLASPHDHRVELVELGDPDRRRELREAVVPRARLEHARRRLPVVSQHPERLRELGIVGEHRAALARRHELAWMEAQTARDPHAPARTSAREHAADRTRRVLHHRHVERDRVQRIAELIDRDRELHVARRPQALARRVPRPRVDVREPHVEPELERGVRGRRPGQRGHRDRIAGTKSERAVDERERGGPVRDRDREASPAARRERLFEARDHRPLHQHPRAQHRGRRLELGLVDPRTRERNHRRAG